MWTKSYQDYQEDDPLIKEQVSSGKGIIGCEMHDVNGWNQTFHHSPPTKKAGVIRTLLRSLFGSASKG